MAINKYLLDAKEHYRQGLRVRNKWMVRIRWYYITLLPAVAIVSTLLVSSDKTPVKHYILVAFIGLLVNGLLWATTLSRKGNITYYRAVAVAQVLLDLGLASYVIYSQRGIFSRGTLLYAVPVMAAGLLFMSGFAYLAAVASALAYSGTILIYLQRHPGAYSLREALIPMVFYSCVFFVLAAILSFYSNVNAMDERQKSYGELIAMMRHQLHHPTGVIAALVEMVERGENFPKLTAQEQEFIKQISLENHRLNTMITNLLGAVQDEEDNKLHAEEPINITNLLEETARICASSARRTKDLQVNYPIKAIMVAGQSEQLMVAFENIIDNAFRYSQSGTPVTITVKQEEPWIQVIIADQGQGISDNLRRQLFQRFNRFEEGTEDEAAQMYSMGLGLYVSKVIIERHDGKLEVVSEPGKGTQIIISL